MANKIIVGEALMPETDFFPAEFDESFSDAANHPHGWGIGTTVNDRWDADFIYDNWDLSWGDGSTINHEEEQYVNPISNPTPDFWSPFEVRNGVGVMKARRVDTGNAAEVAYAKRKSYELTADGNIVTDVDYGGVIPTNYGDVNLEPWNGSGDYYEGNRLLFSDYPMKWLAPMLTTRDRYGFSSQGCRVEARIKWPAGTVYSDDGDIRNDESVFAAFWGYQQYHGGRGTFPYQKSRLLTEIDIAEFLGHDVNLAHHTMHTNEQHRLQSYGHHQGMGGSPLIDLSTSFHTYTLDITPLFIGFAIDGIYRHVIRTPREMRQPLSEYARDSEGKVLLNPSNGFPVRDYVIYEGGAPKYMDFMIILNIAMSGKWARDQMRFDYNEIVTNQGRTYPALPLNQDAVEMEVEYLRVSPGKFATHGGVTYKDVGDRNSGGNLLIPAYAEIA